MTQPSAIERNFPFVGIGASAGGLDGFMKYSIISLMI